MPHHFTKNTVEASFWCNKCGKDTPHRVSDGRRDYRLTCYNRPREEKPIKKPKQEQRELFK